VGTLLKYIYLSNKPYNTKGSSYFSSPNSFLSMMGWIGPASILKCKQSHSLHKPYKCTTVMPSLYIECPSVVLPTWNIDVHTIIICPMASLGMSAHANANPKLSSTRGWVETRCIEISCSAKSFTGRSLYLARKETSFSCNVGVDMSLAVW
jgi:hypothetical protein